MTLNPLKKLAELGQSVWYDYIRRDLYQGGELERLIEDDGLAGMTSNPTIFQKAIEETDLYDEAIRRLSGPRLRNEVMRLLSEQAPARAIRRMAEFDLLRFLHADLALTSHLAGLLVDLGKSLAWWTKPWR